jgi:hypothetical protein
MEEAFRPSSRFALLSTIKVQAFGKDRTLPASFHLLAPAFLNLPPADRSVDEPTEMSRLKFPCRTLIPPGDRALMDLPAGLDIFSEPPLHDRQKKGLPFDMSRNAAPSLFEALHGPDRGSQELRYLLLGFLQALTEGQEFSGVHKGPRPPIKEVGVNFFS